LVFETANLDHRVGKAAYRREELRLREQLLNVQYDLKKDGRSACWSSSPACKARAAARR
jgi:hypothetical protein